MSAGGPPAPDYTDIRPTDTRLSWLQRTDVYKFWQPHPETGEPVGTSSESDDLDDGFCFCLISEPEFHTIALGRAGAAPIWPGESGVTFGEPTVLTESAIVAGPMDGVKLTIDSGPGGSSQWGVDDFHSYFRGGYLIFLDADGHADDTQYIGPADNIFVPKRMTTAASVVIMLNKVSQVTITPWTLA